jgi:hypothetical protein
MILLAMNIWLINKGMLYVCINIGYVVFMCNRREVACDLCFVLFQDHIGTMTSYTKYDKFV